MTTRPARFGRQNRRQDDVSADQDGLGRLPALLGAIRRRLRLAWALDTLQLAAPVVAGVALLLVATGWIGPWSVPGGRLAIAVVVLAVAGVIVAAALPRLPDRVVARTADRGLDTRDAFSSALEFGDAAEPWRTRIRDRAVGLAAGGSARDAVRLPWRRRPVIAAAALTPLVIALALTTSPQDRRRAEHQADRAQIDAAAAELEASADELRDDPSAAGTADRLDSLSEELGRTDDVDDAAALLDQAAAELDEARTPDALAERAAAQGLERSLGSEPLPGSQSGADASQQLDDLATAVGSMTNAQLSETADRLDALAATQDAGDPDAAAALSDAADAMRADDAAAAAASLGEASAAQGRASTSAAATAVAGDAAAATRQAADALTGNGAGAGAGTGQGQGNGTGSGSGSGSGSGGGSGQGSGGGAGGSPSGNISGGATSNGSGASGQGGPGRPTGGNNGQNDPDQSPDLDTLFDPAHGSGGDQLTVGGGSGAGDGGVIGLTDAPTNDGAARVPLADAVTDYAAEATRAMDGSVIAPTDRQLVTSYFDALQE